MSSNAYRRAGRGGAGNYFLQSEETNTNQDLESQNPAPSSEHDSQQQQQHEHEKYKTAGRGGAGNWYDVAAQEKLKQTKDITDPRYVPESKRAYAGRGGQGNFEAGQQSKAEGSKPELVDLETGLKKGEKDEGASPITVPEEAHVHSTHQNVNV